MSIIAPLPWWRLPFASALAFNATFRKRCQLCGIYECHSLSISDQKRHCNPHWFNRIQFLCLDCHNSFDWQSSSFQVSTHSLCVNGVASIFYQYPFDKAMLGFKNSQTLHHLGLLVHVVRQLEVPVSCHKYNSVIIRVPTTTKRISTRGFDPLYILAIYLSFHWQIPIFTAIHREERLHQQGLDREQRLNNLDKAFFFQELPTVKNLIIFDDVVTTGATMHEMISSLKHVEENYHIYPRAMLHGRK